MSCMCKTKTWVGDLSYKYLALQESWIAKRTCFNPIDLAFLHMIVAIARYIVLTLLIFL